MESGLLLSVASEEWDGGSVEEKYGSQEGKGCVGKEGGKPGRGRKKGGGG